MLGSHHHFVKQQRKPSRRGRLCCALGTDGAQRAEDAGHDHSELELFGEVLTAQPHTSCVESRRSSSGSRYGVAATQKKSAQASKALPETECRSATALENTHHRTLGENRRAAKYICERVGFSRRMTLLPTWVSL